MKSPASDKHAYIRLTFRVSAEDGQYASYCDELGTASCGDTVEEALANLNEAVTLHLETLEELGERGRFLRERGIRVERSPLTGKRPVKVNVYPGSLTTRTSIAIAV